MKKTRKLAISLLSVATAMSVSTGVVFADFSTHGNNAVPLGKTPVTKINNRINFNVEDYFDDSVVYKLPETVSESDDISVIVEMSTENVVDSYNKSNSLLSVSDYARSATAKSVVSASNSERTNLLNKLNAAGVNYTLGEVYDTVLSGFEITIKARDFEKVGKILPTATLIIGEVYEECKTEVVSNMVDVYETGIFDGSKSDYDGSGVVVAVLDTGLDYTHSAFDVKQFTSDNKALTVQKVAQKLSESDFCAETLTSGLTAADVYVNDKVPYAYDYADHDTDVLPTYSEHGTHVAGIIAGKDDENKEDGITGVAPNAQLAIFKVFSDKQDGAKSSWILSALEDCVKLGVDVINMSLGADCGFSRETDKQKVNEVYDSVKEAGISLICAAGNSYSSALGSEKNGNNPLTSNPDSSTISSPGTYDASLTVASVNGVETPYLTFNDNIIYFTEAFTSSADQHKSFVNDVLNKIGEIKGQYFDSYDFEYVTIPGIGRSSDYPDTKEYYNGKIVLVKRGTTTFEDKVRIALKEMGAAGIIIYNNVSGDISMSVGADIGAVCSISQDNGEMLAAQGKGILHVSRLNTAGPFMSDFSGWGPSPDLTIKPEITAHGGEIYSAVLGGKYEKMSGTSMACPNQAGVTALVRQYVKYSGEFGTYVGDGGTLTDQQVTVLVNQLMMSTADIVLNKNGLAYAVRKQGAGLVNLTKSTTTASYITTYKNGVAMDKAKIELGDDKNKVGVYEMTFDITNFKGSAVSYDVGSIVMTEGVATTFTGHGEKTVTQDGYLLGSKIAVTDVSGGTLSGNTVTVDANSTVKVTAKLTLTDEDKKYLDVSFANGMYVEGFLTFAAKSGTTVGLSVPFLAFYGDWTKAPIFDEEYYDTNADELNKGLDDRDKLMADAYATRIYGGLYSDYITTLGAYAFTQDPSQTPIAANKDKIAISNQDTDNNVTVNSLRSVIAGLLRNAKTVDVSIVEDSTGIEIFNKTVNDTRKSNGTGSTIYGSTIDIDFKTLDYNLKNNVKYTVTLTASLDYKGEQNNDRDVFTFPLYIDFEAPVVTDVEFRVEREQTSGQATKTRLFADVSVYDNHYAMGVAFGYITEAAPDSDYTFEMQSLGKYMTPVYSTFNSTSKVSIELTDYIEQLKDSVGVDYKENGDFEVIYDTYTFIASCYDYAFNNATYEIPLPKNVLSMYFEKESVNLSPNETLDLGTVLNVFPTTSWVQMLSFTSSDTDSVDVVNQTIIAKQNTGSDVVITAQGTDADGNVVTATLNVHVLTEGEEGYVGNYSFPEISSFTLTGYKTLKAYYSTSSDDREIGTTDSINGFGASKELKMYPSESVKVDYVLNTYFPDDVTVSFKSSNAKVSVSDDGVITANEKGTAIVNINILFKGKTTPYSARIAVTVKDPFTYSGIYLMSYKGNGGTVTIPGDHGVTTIYDYAFSNYEFVDKDLNNGDVIDEEDPYYIKQMYIGEDTIEEIYIPEGVTTINKYAFAKLTALTTVHLPSTLTKIGVGAFIGCTNLTTINLENVQFVNENAFLDCTSLQDVNLSNIVAIGNNAFENCSITSIELPKTSQSLAEGSFRNNANLSSVVFLADKIKIGPKAFENCTSLTVVDINASVISAYAFNGCTLLDTVYFGKDVSIIGEYAFGGTKVASFTLDPSNKELTLEGVTGNNQGTMLMRGDSLVFVAPNCASTTITTSASSIETGAFSGNKKVTKIIAENLVSIAPYTFAGCSNLREISFANVQEIGAYAFYECYSLYKRQSTSDTLKVLETSDDCVIGDYAFAYSGIESLKLGERSIVGGYAFSGCVNLATVEVGSDSVIGEYAFYAPIYIYTFDNFVQACKSSGIEYKDIPESDIKLWFDTYYIPYIYEVKDDDGQVVETHTYYSYKFDYQAQSILVDVTLNDGVSVGEGAFFGCVKLTTLTFGNDVVLGTAAFFDALSLETVDLSTVKVIGDNAFAGSSISDLEFVDNQVYYALEKKYVDGEIIATNYKYSTYATKIQTAELTALETLGDSAFANSKQLATVTFGDNLTTIDGYAFYGCSALTTANVSSRIESIGEGAFYGTSLAVADISNVDNIGLGAFYGTNLTTVTLKDGAKIGELAFAYCYDLATVENLGNAEFIGANSFVYTAITEADLTSAKIIGDFAFGGSSVENVIFGDNITEIGENPFFGCPIKTYGVKTEVKFGDAVVGYEYNENYDISKDIKVIDGVIYKTVPTGLVLVSYPVLKDDLSYTVVDGTVRISARAFAYTLLESVTLPRSLKAIGDKAWYGCEKLNLVIFGSYYAPILEEEYDTGYVSYENVPMTGSLIGYEGLGITPYYMWNVLSNYSTIYFGANFIDHIGHINRSLTMVKPVNGQNYDTFILSQYFNCVANGNPAMQDATVDTISLISKIPTKITLTDAIVEAVENARKAYDSLTSMEQKALVTNYSSLTSAERTLEYLRSQQEPVDPVDPVKPDKKPSAFGTFMKNNLVGFIVALVIAGAFVAYVIITNKKKETTK